MKVGDLVKFKNHGLSSSPLGIVISLGILEKAPHMSQPDRNVAYIEWACPYTQTGNYQYCILEVIDESR